MKILHTILDIFFPLRCISCKASGALICSNCLSSFPKAERECEPWIYPLFDYRHPPVKRAIWLLKYSKKRNLASILGTLLYESITEELAELSLLQNFREPILLPIPLSKKRLRERGYNQAELLASKIGTLGRGDLEFIKNVLVKNKETKHQAEIKDRSHRLKNLTDSFTVRNPEKIKGRNIILIDDVITTGATLTEAKKILKKAGAKKIIAFTIAH